MEEEAEGIEISLTDILNSHVTPLRVTACSKRWWTPKLKNIRKDYGRIKRLYQHRRVSKFTLRRTRNSYYHMVRQFKHKCWDELLQGPEEVQGKRTSDTQKEQENRGLTDTERCWIALWYTKSWMSSTMPVLKKADDRVATTLEEKEELIRRAAFSLPQDDLVEPPPSPPHTGTTQHTIGWI